MSDRLGAVQAELLLPDEIDVALAARSVVYIPLGSIEFHSAHLPVGLDGLNAHGVCTRTAAGSGGIVLPTLYYGVGGGHTAYPWTIMANSASTLVELIEQTLRRLSDFGVKTAVLFTGHFSDEQLALIDSVAKQWNANNTAMQAVALSVNRTNARIPPDHAGIFETTLLSAIWPNRVQLERLPPLAQAPSDDPAGDVMGLHRHDSSHPLYGVFGPDPRMFDANRGEEMLAAIVAWTTEQVDCAIASGSQPAADGPPPAVD